MNKITTIQKLESLQGSTYVYAVIAMLVAFSISVIVAQMIAYQPRNDRSYVRRRLWSAIICVVFALGFWLYNQLVVIGTITKMPLQDKFAMTNLLCLVIIVIGYALLGLIGSLVFRKSKFATIFFKSANKKK
ncbi:MAG: hypothetical protein IKN11_05815 [Bacteroidales bacterium]|nr:hypothetical protein [Bacteroidales bacterium]